MRTGCIRQAYDSAVEERLWVRARGQGSPLRDTLAAISKLPETTGRKARG